MIGMEEMEYGLFASRANYLKNIIGINMDLHIIIAIGKYHIQQKVIYYPIVEIDLNSVSNPK